MTEFRIADTFTDSLARLTGDEQKAVKTTAFDLQMNPAAPGMQFHRLEKSRDKHFWSLRVSRDIRLIVHRTNESLLLCYVDHHDAAYQWAERRKLEKHPWTGAAQWVEINERVEEIVVPRYVEAPATAVAKPPLFSHVAADDLLACGVPLDWLDAVRAATENDVLDLASHLPGEAADALLTLATGGVPEALRETLPDDLRPPVEADRLAERDEPVPPPVSVTPDSHAFEHPDAQRRFRTVANVEELARALEYPWEKWTIFLHPAQRALVEKRYSGPARVSGSAGTGKTVVALHRAVVLARAHPDARVLLTTFSEALARALQTKLRRLIGNEPRIGERLDVDSLENVARRLHERNLGPVEIAPSAVVRSLLQEASEATSRKGRGLNFLEMEWRDVVDPWQLDTWEAYRDVVRLGRKTRLPETQRRALWEVFERVRQGLAAKGLVTRSHVLSRLAAHVATMTHPPYEFIVVDEAQDIGVAELRFVAALGARRPDSLFFAGDLGQRIFQQPFSWKSLGVDVRGRSSTLRINYRTSHQIRAQADRLLGPEIADVDGNTESRRHTVSVFNGPVPRVEVARDAAEEGRVVSSWLGARMAEGILLHETAVFVRSPAQIGRARAAVEGAGAPGRVLDDTTEPRSGHVSIATMHLAKGLEFRIVAVMACDEDVLPLPERIQGVADDSDLRDVYDTERHLLYVACTRARDHLLVTGVAPVSEFLDDLRSPKL